MLTRYKYIKRIFQGTVDLDCKPNNFKGYQQTGNQRTMLLQKTNEQQTSWDIFYKNIQTGRRSFYAPYV